MWQSPNKATDEKCQIWNIPEQDSDLTIKNYYIVKDEELHSYWWQANIFYD